MLLLMVSQTIRSTENQLHLNARIIYEIIRELFAATFSLQTSMNELNANRNQSQMCIHKPLCHQSG